MTPPFATTAGALNRATNRATRTALEDHRAHLGAARPDRFIETMLGVLGKSPATPPGWRRSFIPARIAALVHEFGGRTQPLPRALAQDNSGCSICSWIWAIDVLPPCRRARFSRMFVWLLPLRLRGPSDRSCGTTAVWVMGSNWAPRTSTLHSCYPICLSNWAAAFGRTPAHLRANLRFEAAIHILRVRCAVPQPGAHRDRAAPLA
jgi:hypothetical protein